MATKARLYLRGGTVLVWVFWSERGEVDVWRPADLRADVQDMHPSGTLRVADDDSLNGVDVAPGLSYPLAPLFAMRRTGPAR